MKTEQRHADGTINNRKFMSGKGSVVTSYIMPIVLGALSWLFVTVIDNTDSLHTLEAKVDTFNTLSAEKVQTQIESMEKNIDSLSKSLNTLEEDQKEILKLLIKMNGDK